MMTLWFLHAITLKSLYRDLTLPLIFQGVIHQIITVITTLKMTMGFNQLLHLQGYYTKVCHLYEPQTHFFLIILYYFTQSSSLHLLPLHPLPVKKNTNFSSHIILNISIPINNLL